MFNTILSIVPILLCLCIIGYLIYAFYKSMKDEEKRLKIQEERLQRRYSAHRAKIHEASYEVSKLDTKALRVNNPKRSSQVDSRTSYDDTTNTLLISSYNTDFGSHSSSSSSYCSSDSSSSSSSSSCD